MSTSHLIALLLGICILVASFIVPPIRSSAQVVDFTTLAQYLSFLQLFLLGNFLIWLAVLTNDPH